PYYRWGGGNLYDPSYAFPQLIMVKRVDHFAKFDISGDRMQVTVISDDNTTLDSFIINARKGSIEKLFRGISQDLPGDDRLPVRLQV
ncbi:MAG: hypothetical protein LUQ38_01335, partial [Methanotrichaceae archaeon]|nr:hypothetical protein [Methanotrichaceae archaeon]